MAKDIFGDVTTRNVAKNGVDGERILAIILAGTSMFFGGFILWKFEMVTALLALAVAEILTTAIPVFAVMIFVIYIVCRIKWRSMRRWL